MRFKWHSDSQQLSAGTLPTGNNLSPKLKKKTTLNQGEIDSFEKLSDKKYWHSPVVKDKTKKRDMANLTEYHSLFVHRQAKEETGC